MIIEHGELLDKLMGKFHLFSDGVRVSMLINRGIQNSNKGSKRWISKLISTGPEEFRENIRKLIELQYHLNDPDIRLYISCNSRKLDKAINHFQHMILDVLPEQKNRFYSRINDRFCSCLMQPENRETRYFLIDYDSPVTERFDACIREHEIKVIIRYSTPNGWHYITQGFNPETIKHFADADVKKDGLILLNTLEK